jgi:hypothetical protein
LRSAPTAGSAQFDVLTVQRINVADPDGTIRLAIANGPRFPEVTLRGKTYPNAQRSIRDTAGMIFFDTKGEETGGLVLAKLRDEDFANITFDYTYQPTDGLYFVKRESEDGQRWQAGFGISDRRPFQAGEIESTQGVRRIWLANENQNAQLIISDQEGRPRIRVGVDAAGEPRMEMLDAQGEIVYRATPERGN